MNGPLEGLRVYRTFVRTAFLNILAYRLRYYTGIITYTLFVAVHYYIWQAVFAASTASGGTIHGFTFPDMVTYLAVGWIARSCYFSTIDEDIDEMVRSGQVSLIVIRPVNFHLMMLAQAVGESLFRVMFFTVPIALAVTWCFQVQLPADTLSGSLFLVFSLGSFLILAELNFLVGLLAFRLQSIQGVSRAKYALTQLFSGLLLPIAFFPGWARVVLHALPFQLLTAVPLQFYLGKVPHGDIAGLVAQLIGWCVALSVSSELLWRRSLQSLSIQGG